MFSFLLRQAMESRIQTLSFTLPFHNCLNDRLCGLVVRVPGYTSRDPGFDSRRYQIFWEVVGLKRGPLSLVSVSEELLEWEVAVAV
jgi:hypothetical protein